MKESTKKGLKFNVLLYAAIFGLVALASFVDRHERIDADLVASNRATLAKCNSHSSPCVDGFIRIRTNGIVHIAATQETVFSGDLTVDHLLELLARNDEEADRFFNRMDSLVLKSDRARWQDALSIWAMSHSSY